LEDLKKEESEYKEITEESKRSFSLKKLIEKIIDCCKE
jgi:hypothetical protein